MLNLNRMEFNYILFILGIIGGVVISNYILLKKSTKSLSFLEKEKKIDKLNKEIIHEKEMEPEISNMSEIYQQLNEKEPEELQIEEIIQEPISKKTKKPNKVKIQNENSGE